MQVSRWDLRIQWGGPASLSLLELDEWEGCNPVSLPKRALLPALVLARNLTLSSSSITFQGYFFFLLLG